MIVIKENERLYLDNWCYNASRIISELASVVENNGGVVKPTKAAIISNRTLSAAVRDLTDKIKQFKAIQEAAPNEKREKYINARKNELEKYLSINNDPIRVTHTTYISFVLDNTHYYYQVNDNPFFEFYYQKTPVKYNKISRDAVLLEDKKEWLYDCFFTFSASQSDIKEAANLIFNMLMNAKNSPIRLDSTRRRVPNTYDGGYHYERVYEKERFENISEWAVIE
jgi:hypothetical protein